MIGARSLALVASVVASLAACSSPETAPVVAASTSPAALYTPARVVPGRLEYAPDGSIFAPILTERTAYPTQREANAAYLRSMASTPSSESAPTSIRLFGCQPGALDGETARLTRSRGPAVLCAVDFLDAGGHRLSREVVNFAYADGAWTLQPVYPPRAAVPWKNRETSPKDFWRWVPGRPRYE